MFVWRITCFVLIIVCCLLMYSALLSPTGWHAYDSLKNHYHALQDEALTLDKKNKDLSREIRLLRSDREYLDRYMRTEVHYLKSNEVLYLFHNAPQQGAQ